MSAVNAEVAVLIVGGGPVGLTARALLERWGVRASLVEKHGGLSPFPRARLVNVRSMEIYRRLGIADTITADAFAPEYGRIRFRDTLRDRDFATAPMAGVNAPVPESPAIGVVTSQDRLEPTLLAAANAPVRFGVELIDLAEEADSVVALLVDHRRGAETRVRARYVLAADGANSTARQRLGIGITGPRGDGGLHHRPVRRRPQPLVRPPARRGLLHGTRHVRPALPRARVGLVRAHPRRIRPDGHIGARWHERPPNDSTLHRALTTITGSTPP